MILEELFEYSTKDILYVEYLLKVSKRLDIDNEELKNAIISHFPKHNEFKRVESLNVFHKRIIINAIIIELAKRYADNNHLDRMNVLLKISELINNPGNDLVQLILKVNLLSLSKKECLEKFDSIFKKELKFK